MAIALELARMTPDESKNFRQRIATAVLTGKEISLGEINHTSNNTGIMRDDLAIARIRNELAHLGAKFEEPKIDPENTHQRTKFELFALDTLLIGEFDEVRSSMGWGGDNQPFYTKVPIQRSDMKFFAWQMSEQSTDAPSEATIDNETTRNRFILLMALTQTAETGKEQKFVVKLKSPLEDEKAEELERDIDQAVQQTFNPETVEDNESIPLEDGSIVESKITYYLIIWDGKPLAIKKNSKLP